MVIQSAGHCKGDFQEFVNGVLWDMKRPLEGDCELKLFTFDSDEGRDTFWHSSAHILGEVS
ncbi:unnamed protein product [Linum tenue]|uniref:Threonyl-tRNA synthetase n=1 Tax=Linum tenue TaxID=586396 RepID=A0AAV0NWB2_9ROSI|nr:unnamed protein product [Linum tenue]